ncbi:MAG: hypothetical protein CSB48_07465 [Proteobacteria bacterium]|nr:MAG: hypothetical protein CSB48_07465 [Pseudomonadota bacterium]PIE40207.1 MAG: hypothetical protein CSA51_02280 [Gammaproteobacteria bacterium]
MSQPSDNGKKINLSQTKKQLQIIQLRGPIMPQRKICRMLWKLKAQKKRSKKMSIQSIQKVMKKSLKGQGRFGEMTPEEFEKETAALAEMAQTEMKMLMMVGSSQAEAESEAIQIMLKYQASP